MTIKELRRLSGLTQAAFAEKIGCSRRNVENWESGRNCPPEYVFDLIEYFLKHENLIKEEHEQ